MRTPSGLETRTAFPSPALLTKGWRSGGVGGWPGPSSSYSCTEETGGSLALADWFQQQMIPCGDEDQRLLGMLQQVPGALRQVLGVLLWELGMVMWVLGTMLWALGMTLRELDTMLRLLDRFLRVLGTTLRVEGTILRGPEKPPSPARRLDELTRGRDDLGWLLEDGTQSFH